MIISLIEMLELPNFGDMTTSIAPLELCDNVTDISYDFVIFISEIQ